MAITFTVASKFFKDVETNSAAIKSWLDGLTITTVHGFVARKVGSRTLFTVAYA